jgi:hypothetical protein
VGDEIVFMFKAGEPDDSVRLCLRAIADIFSLSHQVKSKTFPEGAKFKASLVPGTVYFVQPDLIYAFSGHSLAETGRMLSQVEEKDQNTLVMYSKDALSVKDLGIIKREKSRQFKGFSSESSISEISDFIRVQKFFEARINELSRHKDHLGILPYLYRSSSDVLFILDLLKARFQERDFDSVFSLARGFVKSESSYWDEGNLEIEIKIAEILEIAVSQNLHLEIKSRALSTLVTIISLLVGPECRNETLFSAIEVLSRSRDHRVVANIIRTKERLGQDLGPYNILLNSDSNRVQADVAIALGRKNFDKEIYSTLKKAIKSKNPFFVASAIYAITNLALYYLEHDSVYLVSNPDFEDLLVKIPPLVEHENIMIQNRARISMSELLEAEVNRFLPAAFDGTLDSTNFKN